MTLGKVNKGVHIAPPMFFSATRGTALGKEIALMWLSENLPASVFVQDFRDARSVGNTWRLAGMLEAFR